MSALCLDIRQGDYSYEEKWFLVRGLTDEQGVSNYEMPVVGVVVLTQTCDIVRNWNVRPYLELCPLVEISETRIMIEIEKGRRPQYAFLPAVAELNLAADLDRVMTIEKILAKDWEFHQGCTTTREQRMFSEAVARKHNRYAFPNTFVNFVEPLRKRILDKHSRQSPEGIILRTLSEISVAAISSWNICPFGVTFYFLVSDGASVTIELQDQCDKFIELLPETESVNEINGIITSYAEISAYEYMRSIPLDFDHLSETE